MHDPSDPTDHHSASSAAGGHASPAREGGQRLGRFLVVTAQLALLLLLAGRFQIEGIRGFVRIAPVVFVGFVVHAWLPLRFRHAFFLFISLVAIGLVLGPVNGSWLVGIGLLLVGLCHLPVPFPARVGGVLAAGVALACVRAQWVSADWAPAVLPIAGSMFMFRLAVYLYDLRNEKQAATPWERLSYFFLLPNVCFLLFPIVDYQTYRRTYYDRDPHEIYQKGLLWMVRGMTHLLLYRLVYYNALPAPGSVAGLGGVIQSMVATYLLYLRISGQFHLIAGTLCLFGFNLPETHRLYYLASGFNDYWRRINIYWKDFTMKLLFYPVLMRVRRRGMNFALVVATLFTFLVTCLLHSYQWFWLRGSFALTVTDVIFWGTLGALVTANTLLEARSGERRRLRAPSWSLAAALRLSLKTVGMFVVLCSLWSLWSAGTVRDWLSLLSSARSSPPGAYAVLLLALAVLVGVGVLVQWGTSRGWAWPLGGAHPPFKPSAICTSTALLLLALASLPGVHGRFGAGASSVVAALRSERLNAQDEAKLERGYYEGLLESTSLTSALWSTQVEKPKGWGRIQDSDVVLRGKGLLYFELKPNFDGEWKGVRLTTNEWGMADKDYSLHRPPDTYRIALVGSSYTMGPGVPRDRTFEAIVEDRLNRDLADGSHERIEILNFAVGGYSLLNNVEVVRSRIFRFEPDAVWLVVHPEFRRLLMHLRYNVNESEAFPDAYLNDVVARSGARRGMSDAEINSRFGPYVPDIIRWCLAQIASSCKERGITPVWIYLPTTDEDTETGPFRLDEFRGWAPEAGFVTWSLEGVYGDHDKASLWLAPWDRHPNAEGHQVIADRLYRIIREYDPDLGLRRSDRSRLAGPRDSP